MAPQSPTLNPPLLLGKIQSRESESPLLHKLPEDKLSVGKSCPTNIDGQKIKQSELVKLLGVQIDNQLSFDMHVMELCQKMNQKLCAFSRIRLFLNRKKTKILLTSIVISNLSYCPLIWMFCCKSANKEINRTNKHALRVLYEDYDSSFEQQFD